MPCGCSNPVEGGDKVVTTGCHDTEPGPEPVVQVPCGADL